MKQAGSIPDVMNILPKSKQILIKPLIYYKGGKALNSRFREGFRLYLCCKHTVIMLIIDQYCHLVRYCLGLQPKSMLSGRDRGCGVIREINAEFWETLSFNI